MDARLERPDRSQQRLDRQCTRNVGSVGEPPGAVDRKDSHREHPFGAVQEAQPFLGVELQRCDPVLGHQLGGWSDGVAVAKKPFPDERQSEVRERRQIAARPH